MSEAAGEAAPIGAEVLAELVKLGAAVISDAMGRSGAMAGIGPLPAPGVAVAGPAFTVRTRPHDNLFVHRALDLAAPGDIIVVDADGDMGSAMVGEIMCRIAKQRGVAAFVVDGAVRDVLEVRDLGFPLYARGVTPRGPHKDGPGEVGGAVCCGGVVVHQGDVVVADSDGVTVVPRRASAAVLEQARAVARKEATMLADLEAGRLDRSWVMKAIRARYRG